MAIINKRDTDGIKGTLAEGEFGYDAQGADRGRVYVGTNLGNSALAKKSEVDSKAASNQTMYIGTTANAINRSSASQTLTGVSIDGTAAIATTANSLNTSNSYTGVNITATGSLVFGSGGTLGPGSIYSDSNCGVIYRAKQANPVIAEHQWAKSDGTNIMSLTSTGMLNTGGINSGGTITGTTGNFSGINVTSTGSGESVFKPTATNQFHRLTVAASDYSSLPSYASTSIMHYGNTASGNFTTGIPNAGLGGLWSQNLSAMVIGNNSNAPIYILNDGTIKATLDTAGNLGLGTTSPANSKFGRTFTTQVTGAASVAITAGDYSSGAASTVTAVESLGARGDGNATFGGRFGASYRRNDGLTIPAGNTIGYYAFGGQWGTDVGYVPSKHLYTASICGVSEGAFTSATAMATGISFRTGPTGESLGDVNTTYGTEKMRLSSGGVLGLMTSPKIWHGTMRAFQVGGATSVVDNNSNETYICTNTYHDGTAWKYLNNGTAQIIDCTSGATYFYTAGSGTAGNTVSWTQIGRFDSAGVYASSFNGYTPVQQGGGAGQSTNKIYIGWSGTSLKAQVDGSDMGKIWCDNTATSSLGVSGYQRFPSGLIIQWGYKAGGVSGDDSATFPIAFPTVYLSGVATMNGNSADSGEHLTAHIISTSTSSISVRKVYGQATTTGAASQGWNYVVFGY